MLKDICRYFNKSQIWLSSKSGKKRLIQCKEMTGGTSFNHFLKYHELQFDYIIEIERDMTYKQVGEILYDNNHYENGYNFIHKYAYRIYDYDEFLDIDTIEKLRLIMSKKDKL